MEKYEYVMGAYNTLRNNGLVHTQKDFARLIGVSEGSVSRILKNDPKYVNDSLVDKIKLFFERNTSLPAMQYDQPDMLTVIPTEAMAGTLVDFCSSVNEYECERMVSPIKGAQYCIKVCGDSMWPEVPNGSQILLKKIMEEQFVEWGKIYCLDTENGPVVKKIYPTDDPQIVECRSTNPDYPPFRINTQYIIGWYRVLMVLALK